MSKNNLACVTPYYNHHVAMGAEMMEKGGWNRPFIFTDAEKEVLNTRKNVGLIDAHSMGKFRVVGEDAAEFMQYLMTNDLDRIKNKQGIYTCFCNYEGGIVDDVIVYQITEHEYFFITNTLSRGRVADWLDLVKQDKQFKVHVFDTTNADGYLAIQGPKSFEFARQLFGPEIDKLDYFSFDTLYLNNVPIMLARTGYTGEFGYEFIFPSEFGHSVWAKLLEDGKSFGIMPVGGKAIQILRSEKSYRSHGTDMTVENNPYEAGLGWVVRLNKNDFAGKQALTEIKERGTNQVLIGFEVLNKINVPAGTKLYDGKEMVGHITTSYNSPTLNKAIAMGYVDRTSKNLKSFAIEREGDKIVMNCPMPFYDPESDRLKSEYYADAVAV